MATLRIELQVRDYELWKSAFEKDAAGRERSGARGYRIFRPAEQDHVVMLDIDFGSVDEAGAFLNTLRTKVWPSPEKSPAKMGEAKTHILEMVEAREY
jgi:hypothetical protein